ncbi:MAG: metallophosphoesterase [Flavobacteriales bacterium]|nr:metallophosphoesterase [Flavobacteriales bacterium]MCX7650203.1 metallophosphoesterase [Flavobacteriales bacterium]MDW8432279.1 metallophosphoesterase [Flavobacteriales bacterium]
MSGREIAIGDVHGCLKSLKALIENQIRPTAQDTLIFVGDLIDRGPDSKGVLDYVMHLQAHVCRTIALMGNHEEVMVSAWENQRTLPRKGLFRKPKNPLMDQWLQLGGKETLKSFGTDNLLHVPDMYLDWLKKMDHYYSSQAFLVVHAGFNFSLDNIYEDIHAMHWVRDFEFDPVKTGGRRVIHGHVPVSLEFIEQVFNNPKFGFVCIDNGCVYRNRLGMGRLVGLDFTHMKLYLQGCLDLV